ncbi:tetratricopeptide repeat protein, partial [Bacteroidia bacterium]|nr:tetratricopeptide repeat protein [Bacteroidia bacterium]
RILLEQGKYDEALDYLKDSDMDDEFMGAQLITLQGDCLSELDKYSEAADKYMKAANARENRLTTPYALQKAGLAYEEAGGYSESIEAYTRLSEKYSDTRFAEDVEVRIGRVKAKMAHK